MSLCTRILLIASLTLSVQALADGNPERDVYYGEQHIHTSWSFDAFAFGDSVTGPEAFYRYARGEPTPHPGGFDVKIGKPLDWGAVTEHAEYMGIVQQAMDPESPLRKSSPLLARTLGLGVEKDALLAFKVLSATIAKGHAIDALSSPAVVSPVWKRIVAIADEYYAPGKFTTFAAYEWTSTPDARNLHRNIFFLDSSKVPEVPFTAIDSHDPRALWSWMDQQRAAGNELLAVSHNGNLSNGFLFPSEVDDQGRPIDRAWAESRLRNEPLTELKQVKGQSETTPGLSPNDEFANYEVFVWQLLGASGSPNAYGSYARQAYKDGVALQQARGFNPHRFGVVGGSDSHVSVVPYRQDNFFGVHGTVDDTPAKRIGGATVLGLNSLWVSPAGLSAVWAEENDREAIFAAMKRKETYATSGVRIPLRFFGAWDYPARLTSRKGWIRDAYSQGVPMGGELAAPPGRGAPTFAVWAMKDPDSANLDRVQIIKGWSLNGQSFEKIYDVAWAGDREPDPASGKLPPIASTVDLSTGSYTNDVGAAELGVVWTDPDFDPSLDAFYYARVLEIPTPRWSTLQAIELGRPPPSGEGYGPIVQERAWSSPIWYEPTPEARQSAPQGTTVADLKRRGARALSSSQLRDLVVGQTVSVHNQVTGQRMEILYGSTGRRIVVSVDGAPADPAAMAELMLGGQVQYQIRDGRLETTLQGEPFRVAVYRLGDQYWAARSNEFGFANYRVERLDP
ncbi:MAG: DUF3604 domain-containing protein [Myxococcota bacterium]